MISFFVFPLDTSVQRNALMREVYLRLKDTANHDMNWTSKLLTCDVRDECFLLEFVLVVLTSYVIW